MEYKYFLPDDSNSCIEHKTDKNSLVIVGANGSGKSRLGVWLEQHNVDLVYRIGAQRSLNFQKYIPQKTLEQASNLLLYGNVFPQRSHDGKYLYDGTKYNYIATLQDDFDNVLAALCAKDNLEHKQFADRYKIARAQHVAFEEDPIFITEKLTKIWREILPHRELRINDGKIEVISGSEGSKVCYDGMDMSDGERVALYLLAQALVVPKNKIVVVDEPEIHLHRSIVNALWSCIEREREDCLFVYLTHDVDFAAEHIGVDKYWIRAYDGKKWDFTPITGSDLPEDLLLKILGSRKKVLFVEGDSGSYDVQLYSVLCPDYYVVPCGSCDVVKLRTKAFKQMFTWHNIEAFGLIDRDFLEDEDINQLLKKGIYTLGLAEIENIFLLPCVMERICKKGPFSDRTKDIILKAKDNIVNLKFAIRIQKYIEEWLHWTIKNKLMQINMQGKTASDVIKDFNESMQKFDFVQMEQEKVMRYQNLIDTNKFEEILVVCNDKKLLDKEIADLFGLNCAETYRQYAISVVREAMIERDITFIESIKKYVPLFNFTSVSN